jgi:hypothetical protein
MPCTNYSGCLFPLILSGKSAKYEAISLLCDVSISSVTLLALTQYSLDHFVLKHSQTSCLTYGESQESQTQETRGKLHFNILS